MRKMKNLFISVLILVFLLCGCNVNTENLHTDMAKAETIENVNKIYSFSEGLAWISFGEEDSYWGCINKKGEMLFKLSTNEYDDPSEYHNGYSYIKSANGSNLYVVDKNGSICSSYDVQTKTSSGNSTIVTNSDEHVVTYGYGYTVVQTHKADFDSAYYLYSIYDANGNVIDTYKSNNDEEIGVNYCGKGIFYFNDDYEKKSYFFEELYYKRHYYFAETKKWIVTEYSEIDEVEFYDNYALLELEYLDDDQYRCEFIFMDLNGNIQKIRVSKDYGWNFRVNSFYDDICLFSDYEKSLATYNIKSNSFRKLTNEQYLSKVDWDRCDDIVCNDNTIIVPLIGEDKENYIVVFDSDWNVILEPFKVINYSFINDDRFIVDNKFIYDTKGNLVCDVTKNSNLSSVRSYSDGVTVANASEYANPLGLYMYKDIYFEFLDTEGNRLFESITVLNKD